MSMKKIEDYIGFYIGCCVVGKYGEGKLVGYDSRGTYCMIHWDKNLTPDEDYMTNDRKAKLPQVKLLLRPLSSITEEEYAYMNEHFPKPDADYNLSGAEKEAERTRYMLSKHFDLFGLIEPSLALDAGEIKK